MPMKSLVKKEPKSSSSASTRTSSFSTVLHTRVSCKSASFEKRVTLLKKKKSLISPGLNGL